MPRISGVTKVLVAINVEAIDDVSCRNKLLNLFASALAAASVSQTRANRIGAVNHDFPAQVKTLDDVLNSRVRAAEEHASGTLDSGANVDSGEARRFIESCLGFGRIGIASSKDNRFSDFEELAGKGAADAARRKGRVSNYDAVCVIVCL